MFSNHNAHVLPCFRSTFLGLSSVFSIVCLYFQGSAAIDSETQIAYAEVDTKTISCVGLL